MKSTRAVDTPQYVPLEKRVKGTLGHPSLLSEGPRPSGVGLATDRPGGISVFRGILW